MEFGFTSIAACIADSISAFRALLVGAPGGGKDDINHVDLERVTLRLLDLDLPFEHVRVIVEDPEERTLVDQGSFDLRQRETFLPARRMISLPSLGTLLPQEGHGSLTRPPLT